MYCNLKSRQGQSHFQKPIRGSKYLWSWWNEGKWRHWLSNSKLFVWTFSLVGFLCQLSTLFHSALPHLSVDPLVPPSTGVAGAESRAIGISLCPTAIISFAPDNTSTFHFHPRNVGGSGKSRRWWTWKWASFPPSLSRWKRMWCHILSELGSWPSGYSHWSTSSHLSASDRTV